MKLWLKKSSNKKLMRSNFNSKNLLWRKSIMLTTLTSLTWAKLMTRKLELSCLTSTRKTNKVSKRTLPPFLTFRLKDSQPDQIFNRRGLPMTWWVETANLTSVGKFHVKLSTSQIIWSKREMMWLPALSPIIRCLQIKRAPSPES